MKSKNVTSRDILVIGFAFDYFSSNTKDEFMINGLRNALMHIKEDIKEGDVEKND